MIAEIQPSFSSHLSMSRKIEYQLSKVKEGNGKVLYTSTGDELAAMPAYMKLISQLNDRVKTTLCGIYSEPLSGRKPFR